MLVASEPKGDYAFLSLKSPAFDLTDRGVSGRPVPAGLDAFVYTERGVYRSGETVHITALLRDAQGAAALNVPLTLVVERPDGVEYRRVAVPDQGVGGRSLSVPINSAASTGTWRVRAFTDPKRPAIGETTFLVEDYVPDRLEFDLAAPAGQISRERAGRGDGRRPLSLRRAGLRPRSGRRDGDRAGQGAAGLRRLSVRPRRRGGRQQPRSRSRTCRRPTTRARRASRSVSTSCRPRPGRWRRRSIVRMAEAGGRAVERKLVAAGRRRPAT